MEFFTFIGWMEYFFLKIDEFRSCTKFQVFETFFWDLCGTRSTLRTGRKYEGAFTTQVQGHLLFHYLTEIFVSFNNS